MLVICLSTISMSLCFSETAAGYDYPINEDIELDYEWIRYIVANLSDLITVDTHGIYQGRYFGGVGDRLAATYISQWMNESTVNLQNRGLAKVYTYPIGNNSYEGEKLDQAIIHTSNNKIDILSYELSFSNGTHTATIPNNESYPVPIRLGQLATSDGPQIVELFDYDDFIKWIAGAVTFSCTIMGNINQNLPADFAGEVVYIEDYSQASENETVDTLHLLEFNTDESDDAYYEKIQKAMDSGGAGFILITTNPSFLADFDLGGFGEKENYGIRNMVNWSGCLYLGTATNAGKSENDSGVTEALEIWRFYGTNNDFDAWECIVGDDSGLSQDWYDGFGDHYNKYAWSMVLVDDKLWIGTSNVQFDSDPFDMDTNGCEVWCYNGTTLLPIVEDDGGEIQSGFMNESDVRNGGARSMVEFPVNSGDIVVGTMRVHSFVWWWMEEKGCQVWIRVA